MKDTVGNKGRQFAERCAARLDGKKISDRIPLNHRITSLTNRLNSSNFVPGREFDQAVIDHLRTLQIFGNDASHPEPFYAKYKPKVIDAMCKIAQYIKPDVVFRSPYSGQNSDFEPILVDMFAKFKINEATQQALSNEGYQFLNELADASVQDLEDVGVKRLIAKRIVNEGINWAQNRIETEREEKEQRRMYELAKTYADQGKYEKAESLSLACFEKMKVTFGDDHPETLKAMRCVASIYGNQGKHEKAESLSLACFEKMKVTLGDDHLDTLKAMSNLASIYGNQGKHEKAEPLYLACFEKMKVTLGDDHLYTLRAMGDVALIYGNQGKHEKAEPMLEKMKVTLGDDHLYTLRAMKNLASTYARQGKYEKAESMFLACFEKMKVTLGDDHPDTLNTMENLRYTQMMNK